MARGASRKTSAQTSVTLRTPKHGGGKLQNGNPGNKGGGRRSNDFLARCLAATEDPELWKASKEKAPLGLLDLSASYTHAKPATQTEITGDVTIKVQFDD